MENQALVSVILPVYNAEKYIADAISSVLAQSYSNFELLILNDGSTDRSLEIIEGFKDDRIKIITNEVNIKLIKTLNKGISLAQGKYIARMDADDICHVDRLQNQVEFMEKHPDYILCGAWANTIDSNGVKTGIIKRIDTDQLLQVNMLFTTPFIHPTVLLRSTIMEHEEYSENALHCEDLELWMRLSEKYKGKFHNITECLLDYRIHDTNISVQHADFQTDHRKDVIKPFIERFAGKMTEDELSHHFKLFESHKGLSADNFKGMKSWISKLLKTNDQKSIYSTIDLEALLLSRWIIICVKSRNFRKLFSSGMSWWKPKVISRVIRLLRFKS